MMTHQHINFFFLVLFNLDDDDVQSWRTILFLWTCVLQMINDKIHEIYKYLCFLGPFWILWPNAYSIVFASDDTYPNNIGQNKATF